jgi:crotonobetainyl-CoA:carnitine CoA-transferase CaiB-like acyl-CoA transferase
MTETAAGAGVLSGIKVVDFGHFVAGPLTAVMLGGSGR